MDLFVLAALVLFAVGGQFAMQRQMQMFQQNSYFVSRYFGWLKQNFSLTDVLHFTLYLAGILCYIFGYRYRIWLLVLAAVYALFTVCRHFVLHSHSIKKLVYTARIKRMIVTASVIEAVLLALFAFCKNHTVSFAAGILVVTICRNRAFFTLLCNFINSPCEKLIARHYLNDAKRILKAHKNMTVIGVTGSFGKTSMKAALNRMLSEKYNVTATPGNYNTPMGIVRTVREHFRPQTEIFLAEMGAKNIGDIKKLCNICHPNIGIISAVGPQHLDTFKTVENVAATKFELADACFANDGTVYVNADSEPAKEKAKSYENGQKFVFYGTEKDADCYADEITYGPNGSTFTLHYGEHRFAVTTKLLGRHNIVNICGAAAMALDLGVDEKQIRFAVAALEQTAHRLEMKPFIGGATLIDDAYNSNPVGCMEAVNVLGSFADMKKIIVTPGLVELGDSEAEYNEKLGIAAAEQCDEIILVGEKRAELLKSGIDKTKFKAAHLHVAKTFKDAMEILTPLCDSRTVVLFENDLPDNYAG